MKIKSDAIKMWCAEHDCTLKDLLRRAHVSRTAYYALTRKDSILPQSIRSLARVMDVPSGDILLDTDKEILNMRKCYLQAQAICQRYPDVHVENVRHTLLCLRDSYEDRLRKGLLRGQTAHLYK